MANQRWQIYDPRTGGERRFELKERRIVSTLTYGFWALEGRSGSWERALPILQRAFQQYTGLGYFTFLPWAPGSRRSVQTVKREFPSLVDLGNVLCASGINPSELVQRVMQKVAEAGGRASGLWSLGVVTSSEDVIRELTVVGGDEASPIFATAAVLHVLQAALCMDDGVDILFPARRAPCACCDA